MNSTAGAPPIPDPLDAVLFDMDGLLLDTEAMHRRAMGKAASMLGIDFPDHLFLRLVGVHRDEDHRTLRGHYGDTFPLAPFYDHSDRLFEEAIATAIPLRPGVHGLLDLLDAHEVPCAVVTSTAAPFATDRLARAGLLDRFDAVVTRSDVRRPKPSPDPYLLGCERLGARAAQSLALEDSPNGLRAAVAAGLATFLIPDLVPADEAGRTLATRVLASLDDATVLIAAALAR